MGAVFFLVAVALICKSILDMAAARASEILTRRHGDLNLVAKKLIERETLSREDLQALLEAKPAVVA